MGGNFREILEEAPRIKFRGAMVFLDRGDVMNFELGTRERQVRRTLQCRVLRERLNTTNPSADRFQINKNYPRRGWLSLAY